MPFLYFILEIISTEKSHIKGIILEQRVQREKVFHDKTFTDDSRQNLSKVYSIAQISNDFYLNYLYSISYKKSLLEIGCGPGYKSFQLAQNGAAVTGIDISGVAIDMAKKIAVEQKNKEIKFSVMNAEELDFKNEQFDIICGISILHHLDLNKAYSEIARTLKLSGKALFLEPLGHNPMINLFRRLTPDLRTEDEHPLRVEDIKLAKKYFSNIELNYFHIFTIFAIPFRNFFWFSNLLKMLARIDNIIFRIFPFLKKYSWIMVIVFSK